MNTYKEYFSKLTDIEKKNSPKELYFKGNFSLLSKGRRVSIVGSRNISELGIRRTKKIVKFLVNSNITVVSGLAQGVDAFAHSTAMDNNGNTIAVIGTPLDKYYPKENKHIQDRIAAEQLLLSQFPEGYPISPKNFPIRNRTMALISDATIIIEASEKSGTKHQGWEALRLGRNLFIMENIIKDGKVTWAKEMLDYGAEILTNKNYENLIDEIPYLTSKEECIF
ncbi:MULTISPECIES: DNA-processing protein DprA [unclassified Apibacter]|uniref:DNA-processing protein DprA n=1 Tax=unclassified Apibacter TaxID=2630820 RepID=UPI001323F495|nr:MULTISPECIES: DNA-processing protein DprA [unclassified Apibacter]MCX8676281.1 DNA-protecting protein DprA [Apibacter sp. B3919]MXO23747.1 DNA-processing protein DprA [Apibacter sp. B3924]MXO26575.1 DNA-processing protein DprA [Apibacter sp. B3813]MXO29442.1 DNA-processing protein DprA [Apibacter sp. B3913]MXO31394.1 DNA-processing protein DprA [Apibacter sp. B3912]